MHETADAAPWREPVRGAYPEPSALAGTGAELLRTVLEDRRRPPISHLFGLRLTEVGLGSAAFAMPCTPWLLSPQGVVSVGTLAILADGPLGCAVHSVLPAATGYLTTELSLRSLRPVRAGGELVARGRVIHAGRTLALSAVQVVDARGRLVADGSSLCFVRPLGAAAPPARPANPWAGEPATPDPFERPVIGEALAQDVWERLGGLEILEAQIAGELPRPPIQHLTGARAVAACAGEAVFAMPCHEWLCSALSTVEGGTIAMLADAALASAIQTTLPAGVAVAPIDLKVNFLRPALPDGRELRAQGRVRHAGRTIAVAEAEVVNADGRPVALATGSAMLLAGRPADLREPS